jgi:murein DD-endopeptidase MepM/ murein hydrolase activator NlpD
MKLFFIAIACGIHINCFAQLPDREIRHLKTGRVTVDSSYVYALPYEAGKKYLFIQGANSNMSHTNELSFDFKMKKLSPICAARDGKVIATKSDSNKGGLKKEFLGDGNHVIIEHTDGSTAHYWHLSQNSVLVSIGEHVKKGQVIGASGNTGYTAFPHLHFQVFDAKGKQVLPRFSTNKGIHYLRPGRWYKQAEK